MDYKFPVDITLDMVKEEIDDVLPLLMEEDKLKVNNLRSLLWISLEETGEILTREFNENKDLTRKDFAVNFVTKMPSCTKAILFKMYEGVPVEDAVLNYVRTGIGTKDKLASTRMLLGGHHYG